jgi:prefoldin subunit 5
MKKIKQLWLAGKVVLDRFKELQTSIQHLQSQLRELTKTTDALQRSVQRFSFKAQPHLNNIDHLLKK